MFLFSDVSEIPICGAFFNRIHLRLVAQNISADIAQVAGQRVQDSLNLTSAESSMPNHPIVIMRRVYTKFTHGVIRGSSKEDSQRLESQLKGLAPIG